MSYATRDDIDSIYPGELSRVAYDRDQKQIDETLVNTALDMATAEIDGFLSMRYSLPLAPISPLARNWCVDIAIYRMSLTRDKLTNEKRQRYEDAIARLTAVAAGKMGIGNPTLDPKTGLPNAAGGNDARQGRAQIVLMRRQG